MFPYSLDYIMRRLLIDLTPKVSWAGITLPSSLPSR